MNIERFFINLTAVSVPTQWQMTKAKRAYKKTHPLCAVCGYKKKLEIHHITPCHVDMSLACDPDNFITLCRSCHFTFGHFHNFRKYWNPNIVEFAKDISKTYNLDFNNNF
jgi:5-methylcytosine-specific restriction endonuclease McrA